MSINLRHRSFGGKTFTSALVIGRDADSADPYQKYCEMIRVRVGANIPTSAKRFGDVGTFAPTQYFTVRLTVIGGALTVSKCENVDLFFPLNFDSLIPKTHFISL